MLSTLLRGLWTVTRHPLATKRYVSMLLRNVRSAMDIPMAQVKFEGAEVEVPTGFEKLAQATLKCGIGLVAISLEPKDDEFYMVFADTDDCERFADVIVACGSKELIGTLFGASNDKVLQGCFSIDQSEGEDPCRVVVAMELALPMGLRDALTEVFDGAAKMVDAEVDYCDPAARRSNGSITHKTPIPQTEWDGHYVSAVNGVEGLEAGSIVKVTFHAQKPVHATERLWVKVEKVIDDDVYGTVDSHPAAMTNLHRGDKVHFLKIHILHVIDGPAHTEDRMMLN